jgi:hypothetical protein
MAHVNKLNKPAFKAKNKTLFPWGENSSQMLCHKLQISRASLHQYINSALPYQQTLVQKKGLETEHGKNGNCKAKSL